MLKGQTFKVAAVLIMALSLTVSCKSKPKVSDATAPGGVEGQNMDPTVTSDPLQWSTMGGSDSGKISGLTSINFDYDSSTLTTDARRKLGENAEWIKTNTNVTVQIEGHCDKQGSVEYNLSLGERRAKAVKNYLTGLGVDSKRMTIISYGEEKPLDQADNDSAYARNRRANFVPIAQ